MSKNTHNSIEINHYLCGTSSKTHYLKSKKYGLTTGWYENGRKMWEEISRESELYGLDSWWSDGGRKRKDIYPLHCKEYTRIGWDEEGSVSPIRLKKIEVKLPTRPPQMARPKTKPNKIKNA